MLGYAILLRVAIGKKAQGRMPPLRRTLEHREAGSRSGAGACAVHHLRRRPLPSAASAPTATIAPSVPPTAQPEPESDDELGGVRAGTLAGGDLAGGVRSGGGVVSGCDSAFGGGAEHESLSHEQPHEPPWWQWHSPVFRFTWQPQALRPPE